MEIANELFFLLFIYCKMKILDFNAECVYLLNLNSFSKLPLRIRSTLYMVIEVTGGPSSL